MWLLKIKDSNCLYYGSLTHPYHLFPCREDAENYIRSNKLEHMLRTIKVTEELLLRYFGCTY